MSLRAPLRPARSVHDRTAARAVRTGGRRRWTDSAPCGRCGAPARIESLEGNLTARIDKLDIRLRGVEVAVGKLETRVGFVQERLEP